jgi:CheY-like chemotaxis protein
MDETALCLHWPFAQLSPTKQEILRALYENDDILRGRTVLIVDDDIRNIFAMTSVLEQHAMNVLSAESGPQAIEQLTQNANVEIVLMDIMMPDMDGFDTMRAIRRIPRFKSLPIVAVTAKAMKGDREKCMEAGAWDYLSKPVDPLQMVSSCRAWLHR